MFEQCIFAAYDYSMMGDDIPRATVEHSLYVSYSRSWFYDEIVAAQGDANIDHIKLRSAIAIEGIRDMIEWLYAEEYIDIVSARLCSNMSYILQDRLIYEITVMFDRNMLNLNKLKNPMRYKSLNNKDDVIRQRS